MIDVSACNGTVDWKAVAAAGIKSARIRIYRGNDGPDCMAATNVSEARANGVSVQAYAAAYPLPTSTEHPNRDPLGQTRLFAAKARSLGINTLFFDMEFPKLEDLWSQWEQTPAGVLAWLKQALPDLAQQGITPGIYGSPSYLVAIGCMTAPELSQYKLWVAHYGVSSPTVPPPWAAYSAWQYSETGTVQGIKGYTDLSWLRTEA